MYRLKRLLPNKGIGIGDLPFWHICSIWAHLYFTDNPLFIWASWCLHWFLITPYYWAKNHKEALSNSQQRKSEK
jgi:hypothetical protein